MKISQLAHEIQSHPSITEDEKMYAEQILLRLLVSYGFSIQFLKDLHTASSRSKMIEKLDEKVASEIVTTIRTLIDNDLGNNFLSTKSAKLDHLSWCC